MRPLLKSYIATFRAALELELTASCCSGLVQAGSVLVLVSFCKKIQNSKKTKKRNLVFRFFSVLPLFDHFPPRFVDSNFARRHIRSHPQHKFGMFQIWN
jgi:hypothetical protein